jgi:pimeloyl-ACP methyl ester carboxylesterase
MSFIKSFIKNHPIKRIGDGEYVVGGKGKTAFLIFPGSGQDALSCFDLVGEFEKKYKAVAISYTGFYDLDSLFCFVNKILDKEKVDNVVLYGLSLGGFIAQHYVRRYPDKVVKLILSHSGSTKSKTIVRKVSRPGKFFYKIVPLIPQKFLNKIFIPVAGRMQSGKSNFRALYEKYSSKENLERRIEFSKKNTFSMIDKNYLKTVYSLGTEMERVENKFSNKDLSGWKGKILILRTENDPLAQDDGMFKHYYPKAKVVTFKETGHLTPFIRFEQMAFEINKFLNKL